MPSSSDAPKTRKHPIPPVPEFDPDPDLREDAEKREVIATMMGIPAEPPMAYDDLDPRNNLEEPVPTSAPEAEAVEAQFSEVDVPERAIAIVPQPAHHVVTGMAILASMSEAEFTANLSIMKTGQARLRIIQEQLLIEGEDYGKVKGIERPFLHLPGAEKLCNIYGLAVRQETRRVPGDGITTPPLSYMTTSFVHLGNFEGPIVAQGEGEANSWEDKYRYRWSKPECPRCGHEMMKGGNEGKMAGKWFCPGFKGGCWNTIDISAVNPDGTPVIAPAKRIDNPDPYGLAETLVQMSAKRSLVAATRRATGTSGLFTQDDDSPSVREQAGDSDEGPAPVIESASTVGIQVGVGAKTDVSTKVQHDRLKALVAEKGLGGAKIAALLERLFAMEVAPTGAAASAAVKTLDGEQMGKLLLAIETGEVPNDNHPEDAAGDEAGGDMGAK